jgi:hypothetical protein
VVIRQQTPATRLIQHRVEEGGRNLVLQQALANLGKRRSVESTVGNVEVQEPLEQQVVLQPFAELSLAADGIEGDEQASFEQVLGGIDLRPPGAYMVAKVGERAASARSTIGFIRRSGWSAGTKSFAVRPNSIH